MKRTAVFCLLSLTFLVVFVFGLDCRCGIDGMPSVFAAPDSDVSSQVKVTVLNTRSTANIKAGTITTTAAVNIQNTGTSSISGPVWAVLDISAAGVSAPTATGTWAGLSGWSPAKPYFDLSSQLSGGVWKTGSTLVFNLTLTTPISVKYAYKVLTFASALSHQPPTANAGSNDTIRIPAGQNGISYTLHGSGSPSDSIVTYNWTGSPQPAAVPNPTVSLSAGSYTFSLTVTDNQGATSAPSQVTITVTQNKTPTANAGTDATYKLRYGQQSAQVSLDGSGSTDSDGTIAAYHWSGTPQPSAVTQPVVSLGQGSYSFTLSVTDNEGATSSPCSVHITVESTTPQPPTVALNPTQYTVDEQGKVTVSVTASHPDPTQSVSLTASPGIPNSTFSATQGNPATGSLVFSPVCGQAGVYSVSFKAMDSLGLSATQTAQITVNKVNRPPTLSVPTPLSVNEGAVLIIPITANDPDGDPLSITASPLPVNAVYSDVNRTITFRPDHSQAGSSYDIQCTAGDGQASVSQTVHVTINAVAAGTPLALTLKVDPIAGPAFGTTQTVTGTVNSDSQGSSTSSASPLITGLSPATGEQGQTLHVTLTGGTGIYATNFGSGSRAGFGPNITVNSLTVTSATQATANITISPTAPVGAVGVSITTGSETDVSVVAFNITQGKSSITGVIVDPETGQPIAGAVVSLQGSSYTVTTAADGSFTLNNVPAGSETLVVNAPNHALETLDVSAALGATTDVGTLKPTATVTQWNPNTPPSATVLSLVQRGLTDMTTTQTLDDMKQMIQDAVIAVGGNDIGLLDAYGNQSNPNVTGTPSFTLTPEAVETLAMRSVANETITLGELLECFTGIWGWTDPSGNQSPPLLIDWLNAIQQVVNNAWQDPTDPNHAILFLLFNHGRTLSPDPPQIIANLRLNGLQAHLATMTLMVAAARHLDPEAIHNHVSSIYGANAVRIEKSLFARILDFGTSMLGRMTNSAIAQVKPVAKCANSQYLMYRNDYRQTKQSMSAGQSYSPDNTPITGYQWKIKTKPIGSSSTSLLGGDDQQTCYFSPDVAGDYYVDLTVTNGSGGVSDPFSIYIRVNNECSSVVGNTNAVNSPTFANSDYSWDEVFCQMKQKVPSDVGAMANSSFTNFLKYGMPLGDPTSRANAATAWTQFLSTNGMSSQTIITNSTIWEKNLPSIMAASKASASNFTAFKSLAISQLVSSLQDAGMGQADQLMHDIMYAVLDKMIDVTINSMRPAPPDIVSVDLLDIPTTSVQGAQITFSRSPSDQGADIPSNQHFYYELWRSSPGLGMGRLYIGREGTPAGPMVDPSDSDMLMFLDPTPPQGQVTYYVQTRRIIGSTVSVEQWDEGGFWLGQLINAVAPGYGNVLTQFQAFSDRMLKMYKGLQLQDSDLSVPEMIYIPKPYQRAAPPVQLASTDLASPFHGNVLISFPPANSIFEMQSGNPTLLFECNFASPYEVGVAADVSGHVYADNSASDAQFGGRIFRWDYWNSYARTLFGSVQYYSLDLQLSQPCAVQAMGYGWYGSGDHLFIADSYSNTLRMLDIPASGELPPNPSHYVSQPVSTISSFNISQNSSLAVSPTMGPHMTQDDNIFRLTSQGGEMLMSFSKPFSSLSGIDFDRWATMYLADNAAGTITTVPFGRANEGFWSQLVNDPAISSLYTLVSGLSSPGDLRVTGDGTQMIWVDLDGYHTRVFGISARLVDSGGNPLQGAYVIGDERGQVHTQVKTDQYGVFHMDGLLLPGQPLQVTLTVQTSDGQAGTYVVPLSAVGETIIESFTFTPTVIPTETSQTLPSQPPAPPNRQQIVSGGGTTIVPVTVQTPQTTVPSPPPSNSPSVAPRVELIAPVNGMSVGSYTMPVVGTVSDSSVTEVFVTVNGVGMQVPVQSNQFNANVTLQDGWNGIQVTGTNPSSQLSGTSGITRVLRTDTPATGALAGVVKDQTTGSPVTGMTVSIAGTGASAITDNLGVWQIGAVTPGTVTLQFQP